MNNDVVTYGGGVAGVSLALELSKKHKVSLVSPLDYFEVPMAMPRNLVKPDYTEKSTILLKDALPNVNLLRGKLVDLRDRVAIVEDMDGNQVETEGKVMVFATGSRFLDPLTRPLSGDRLSRKEALQNRLNEIANAQKILIVGGGAVGVEIAGEIVQNYPNKKVTIVEGGDQILRGTDAKTAKVAEKKLRDRKVDVIYNQMIENPTPKDEKARLGGVATLSGGNQIEYDLILWCVGGAPNTEFMQTNYSHLLNDRNQIMVDENLRVKSMQNVLALGDITDLDEAKKAMYVRDHVSTAVKNVELMLKGVNKGFATYKAKTGDNMMLATLGDNDGVASVPMFGTLKAPWLMRAFKAKTMLVPMYMNKFK